jgi:hypothetical protein
MRVLALLCLSGTLLVAQQQTPARDAARTQRRVGTGAIRGRVVTADTGAPIRRARVSLSTDDASQAARSTVTDVAGRFSFEKLTPDAYHVSVVTRKTSRTSRASSAPRMRDVCS